MIRKTSEVETLYGVLTCVDFSFAVALLSSLYHPPGTCGHPFLDPLILLKIELVKGLMEVKSYVEVHLRLLVSDEWRRVCGIESGGKVPHPSTWTRFRRRVGAAGLELILSDLLR